MWQGNTCHLFDELLVAVICHAMLLPSDAFDEEAVKNWVLNGCWDQRWWDSTQVYPGIVGWVSQRCSQTGFGLTQHLQRKCLWCFCAKDVCYSEWEISTKRQRRVSTSLFIWSLVVPSAPILTRWSGVSPLTRVLACYYFWRRLPMMQRKKTKPSTRSVAKRFCTK